MGEDRIAESGEQRAESKIQASTAREKGRLHELAYGGGDVSPMNSWVKIE
jgi:hypothetical protein